MKKNKGFTLVELLVVIAIIGLLSTLAFVSLNSARGKARDAKRVSDIRAIQSALELMYNNQTTPSYPVGTAITNIQALTGPQSDMDDVTAAIPIAPEPPDGECANSNDYIYSAIDASGTACEGTETCPAYTLRYCLGDPTGSIDEGLNTACETGISC